MISQTQEALRPIQAFGVLDWLARLSEDILARYCRKNKKVGLMQTGLAWRSFSRMVQGVPELEVVTLLGALLRYANTDESEMARLLFRAYVPLSLEHDAFREYVGIDTLGQLSNPRQSIVLVRRTLRRWCDWIESLAHSKVHVTCRGGSGPQFATDKAVILLWPLVKRHDWSCCDLMNVLCLVSRRPATWLCGSEAELTARIQSLGLRVSQRANTSEAPPSGCSIALRYSQFWSI